MFKQTCCRPLLVLSVQRREVRAHRCAMVQMQQQGHLGTMLHTLTNHPKPGTPLGAVAFGTAAAIPPSFAAGP